MKNIKKLICFCTAFLMISSLFSCGNKNSNKALVNSDSMISSPEGADKNSSTHQISQYYEKLALDGAENFSYISSIKCYGDKLYVLGEKYNEEDTSLLSTDLSTLETSPAQTDNSIPDTLQAKNIYKDNKGNIYNCSEASIEIYNKDAKLIKTIDSEFISGYKEVGTSFIYSSAVSENGDIYIAASLKSPESIQIIKLNSSFEIQYITEKGEFSDCGEYIEKIFIDSNGNPVLCTASEDTYVNEISPDTGITLQRYELPYASEIIGGYGNNGIIYRMDNIIYGYDCSTDSTSQLYSVDNSTSQITAAYVRNNHLITEEHNSPGDSMLSIYSKDGKKEKDILLAGKKLICEMSVTPDGTIYLFNGNYTDEYTDNDIFRTMQPEIIKLNEDGTTQTIYKDEKINGVISYSLASDSTGNICLCHTSDDSTVHTSYISSSGEKTDLTCDAKGAIHSVICVNDQFIIKLISDTNSLITLSTDSQTLKVNKTSESPLPEYNFPDMTCGSNEYDFCYTAGSIIYGYKVSDGSSEKIFSWFDSDITCIPDNISSLVMTDPDNIYFIDNSQYHYQYTADQERETFPVSVIHLKKYDEAALDKLNSRNIITISGTDIDNVFFSKIQQFNKSDNDNFIMVNDYSQSDSNITEAVHPELSKLETEISGGNIPDVILGNDSFDIQKLINEDVLIDLNDMLRNDPDTEDSDLAENIIEACTYKDKLYFIPWISELTTLTMPDEYAQGGEMLTFEDFFSLADKYSDKPLINSSRDDIFNLLISSYINDNVNYDKSSCNFQTDVFRKILSKSKEVNTEDEYCNQIYLNGVYMEVHPLKNADDCLYRKNGLIDSGYFISDISDTESQRLSYTIKGIPSSSGTTSILGINKYICITQNSQNKEGAWKFIHYIMSTDNQSDRSVSGYRNAISFSRSENQKNIDNIIADNKKSQSDIEKYTDSLNALYNGKIIISCGNTELYKIIYEEAEKFFNGTQSLDQTVSAVQSKAEQYLSEIR